MWMWTCSKSIQNGKKSWRFNDRVFLSIAFPSVASNVATSPSFFWLPILRAVIFKVAQFEMQPTSFSFGELTWHFDRQTGHKECFSGARCLKSNHRYLLYNQRWTLKYRNSINPDSWGKDFTTQKPRNAQRLTHSHFCYVRRWSH